MSKKVTVILNEKEESLYKDEEDCFGCEDPEATYSASDDNCKLSACEYTKNCKLISEGAIVKFASDSSTENVIEEKTEDTIDRATVLKLVLKVCEANDRTPEVKSMSTRDKVFIGDEDIFIVTKRALKINRLKDGHRLDIDANYWEVDNKGIAVEYNNDVDFEIVIKKALDGLFTEALPQPEEKKVKEDLFEDVSGGNANANAKPEPKTETKPVEAKDLIPTEAIEADLEATVTDLGEVVKILKITKYANGYNEVSITSKASVDSILEKVADILG